jgi:putative hydrolase of the HAD superfamily
MEVKAVLLDFGDTIVSFEDFNYEACLKAFHRNLAENGMVTSYEEFQNTYFEVRDQLYQEGERSFKEFSFNIRASRVLAVLGFDLSPTHSKVVSAVEAFMDGLTESLKMDEHVPLILQELKKRYKLGLVSNFAYPSAIIRALRKFRLFRYFDAIVISGAIGWRKPSPRIFEKALKTLNVSASEAVFVGDAPLQDIAGAGHVGMKTVLLRRLGKEETSDSREPDKIIGKLEELLVALSDW